MSEYNKNEVTLSEEDLDNTEQKIIEAFNKGVFAGKIQERARIIALVHGQSGELWIETHDG